MEESSFRCGDGELSCRVSRRHVTATQSCLRVDTWSERRGDITAHRVADDDILDLSQQLAQRLQKVWRGKKLTRKTDFSPQILSRRSQSSKMSTNKWFRSNADLFNTFTDINSSKAVSIAGRFGLQELNLFIPDFSCSGILSSQFKTRPENWKTCRKGKKIQIKAMKYHWRKLDLNKVLGTSYENEVYEIIEPSKWSPRCAETAQSVAGSATASPIDGLPKRRSLGSQRHRAKPVHHRPLSSTTEKKTIERIRLDKPIR